MHEFRREKGSKGQGPSMESLTKAQHSRTREKRTKHGRSGSFGNKIQKHGLLKKDRDPTVENE